MRNKLVDQDPHH